VDVGGEGIRAAMRRRPERPDGGPFDRSRTMTALRAAHPDGA
jgi:hypothetical protein